MRATGDGFLWPDLAVLPEGTSTRLMWQKHRGPTHSPIGQFLSAGEKLVESEATRFALAEFVESVVARLGEYSLATPLDEEWAAIRSTTGEEREFCIAAARLGLDPYQVSGPTEALLLKAAEHLEEHLLDDLLDAVTVSKLAAGIAWVDQAAHLIEEDTSDPSDQLIELRGHGAGTEHHSGAPWRRGWDQARETRQRLGIDPDVRFDFADMVQAHIGKSGDRGLQGLGGWGSSGAGTVVTGRQLSPRSQRFAEGRALWHFIFDPNDARFLLTPSAAEHQRIERAFSAELLAPAEGVRERLADESNVVTLDDISDVAQHFDAASTIVRHQAENQLGLTVA